MKELIDQVDEILKKSELPDRHTYFQLEKFNIGREPTAQAQLWQIVRELQVRRDTVESYDKDLKDAEDNLELMDLKIERLNREIKEMSKTESTFADLNIQEHEITIRKLQREKESLIKAAQKVNQKLKYIFEEIAFLVRGFGTIVDQVGEMKPLDDEQAQKQMWNEKLLEELNLRVLLQRPLDADLVRTIMCLNDDAPVKQQVIKILEFRQNQMLSQNACSHQDPIRAKIVGKKPE